MTNSPAPYIFDIETLLTASQPRSILAVGPAAVDPLQEYLKQREFLKEPCHVTEVRDPAQGLPAEIGRHDAGVIVGALEKIPKVAGLQLLARMRDLLTKQFCVVVSISEQSDAQEGNWQPNEFLGLGLSVVNQYDFEQGPFLVLKYDIATYKKTPDWLNANNWANPELWDKYRW